jgi:hypothetical protein
MLINNSFFIHKIIQALSRKAFVLSEIGNFEESLQTIEIALQKDPTNVELLKFKKELNVIEKEKKDEQNVEKILLDNHVNNGFFLFFYIFFLLMIFFLLYNIDVFKF